MTHLVLLGVRLDNYNKDDNIIIIIGLVANPNNTFYFVMRLSYIYI